MCGCDRHREPSAECTCLCAEHKNFELAAELANRRYDIITELEAEVATLRNLLARIKTQAAVPHEAFDSTANMILPIREIISEWELSE